MKDNILHNYSMRNNKGFTLLETVIALSIAVIVIGFFLGTLIPASLRIARAKNIQEARLMAEALESEMNTPRQLLDEDTDQDGNGTVSRFEKSFDWVSGVIKEDGTSYPTGEGIIIAFNYRADAHAETDAIIDGVYPPYLEGGEFLTDDASDSQPMTIKTRIGKIDDILNDSVGAGFTPLDTVEGPVFAISLTQLVPVADTDQSLLGFTYEVDTDPAGIAELKIAEFINGGSGEAVTISLETAEYNSFTEGKILVQADFYLLDSSDRGFITALSNGQQELSARPLYSTRFGIIR